MLIRGDARAIPLASGAAQCVVTSPPYWGLRDYRTATWEGGDAECSHRVPATGSTQNKGNNNPEGTPFAGDCRLCGARRIDRQLGLEPTPDSYVANMVQVFREVWRVLKDDGTVWLNLGDSYATAGGAVGNCPSGGKQGESWKMRGKMTAPNRLKLPGLKPKDLVGIPWRVAFALQADGWYLRSDIIWAKPNLMPESVTDRPTKSHEYLFLLTKGERYYYDQDAIRESLSESSIERVQYGWQTNRMNVGNSLARGETVDTKIAQMGNRFAPEQGRNLRSVWTIVTQPYPEAHYATFPEELPRRCILAGSRMGDLVLDPFIGSGTVGAVAEQLGRRWVGLDLGYQHLAKARTAQRGLAFAEISARA